MALEETALREHLTRILSWEEAHANFDTVTTGVPEKLRGSVPRGLPYSPWQILEHMRLTQRDILEFCVDPNYQEKTWPDDYWPTSETPPSPGAWDATIVAYRNDRAELQKLAQDPAITLDARIPHGTGQTYLREILLVADHAAYHLGELVVVRRLLGAWP